MFQKRHINRMQFPDTHILVVEDDLHHQREFVEWANTIWSRQGKVQFDFVCSGLSAASIINSLEIDLIILDHDLPVGNGTDLLRWMKHSCHLNIPIITASGIPQNNDHMERLCKELSIEVYKYDKFQVIAGGANAKIFELLARRKAA